MSSAEKNTYLTPNGSPSLHDGDECPVCFHSHRVDDTLTLLRAEDVTFQPDHILAILHDPVTNTDWSTGHTRIRGNLFVKHRLETRLVEAQSSEFVRQNTSILVPPVLLVFCAHRCMYIVSEFIDGVSLHECWGVLGTAEKGLVAEMVASYIHQLQALRPTTARPGPLDPHSVWRGRWFTYYHLDPLESYKALVDWLNHKSDVAKRFGCGGTQEPFTCEHPLVFTHGDIAMRNFIRDSEGRLWLLDWEDAGFYPVYMEYASMAVQVDDDDADTREWIEALTRVVKRYDVEFDMLKSIAWALTTAPLA